ncbi:MAG TPA: type 1 glutamine amidotransferase [Desulfuromonadaceae bacterium]|jgi:GMP synthase-like glutamine amidotransferase
MIHIIQNDPQVPPGLLADQLDRLKQRWSLVQTWREEALPEPSLITAVIVLGGAMGANEDTKFPFLSPLKKFIGEIVEQGIPYLGVCLGGQLLAAALGAKVVSNRWEELGTLEVTLNQAGCQDPLLKNIGKLLTTFQWHHDSFDLPEGALLLASSPACPHQAFRFGRTAWGLQFHPEVTETIIRDWCAWDPATKVRTEELLNAWRARKVEYCQVSARLLDNFLMVAKDT